MSKFFGFINQSEQGRFTDLSLLILRAGAGLSMVYAHGFQKLMKLFGDEPIKFLDPIGIGELSSLYLTTFAEFVCASLLCVGLFTRWVSIPLIISMLVVVFLVKWPEPFIEGEKAWFPLS